MLDTCCYSPQEQILLAGTKGKTNPHRNTHKRLFEILEGFDGMPPIIDIERARLFTASMKGTPAPEPALGQGITAHCGKHHRLRG